MKIVIDGCIGSGKTIQLNILANIGFNVHYLRPLPVHLIDGPRSDRERWGLTFQLYILQSFCKCQSNTIYEGCPLSSKDIYWKSMKRNEIEEQVYKDYYDLQGWSPDLYILLDTPAGGMYHTFFEQLTCPKYKIDATQSIRKVNQIIIGHLVQHGCILEHLVNEHVSLDILKSCNNLLGPIA